MDQQYVELETHEHPDVELADPGEGRYQRAERALWRVTTRGLVILPPVGDPIALTGAAVALWELLEDRLDLADITDRLSARFQVSALDVSVLITPVLRQLVDSGAVEQR